MLSPKDECQSAQGQYYENKTSVWYKNIIYERLLTALKENDPLYAGGGRV